MLLARSRMNTQVTDAYECSTGSVPGTKRRDSKKRIAVLTCSRGFSARRDHASRRAPLQGGRSLRRENNSYSTVTVLYVVWFGSRAGFSKRALRLMGPLNLYPPLVKMISKGRMLHLQRAAGCSCEPRASWRIGASRAIWIEYQPGYQVVYFNHASTTSKVQ